MPVNYVVQAQVVDLRTDTPKATDRFYVDTNAWFWTVYARLGLSPNPPNPSRVSIYPAYLKAALAAASELKWSGLSLSELAHQIERTEFEIYRQTASGLGLTERQLKEFRHNFPAERQRVAQEVEIAWQAVESLGKPLDKPVTIDGPETSAALQELKTRALDGYDIFALRTATASGIMQIVSDDGDFCVVPGIIFFTANRSVVTAAQAQGRLLVR
jgi:hypothetical protein